MEKLTKEIKTILTKPGETNGKAWTRYEFEFVDGFKISTFDNKLGTAFQPGTVVDITLEDKVGTKFKELKDMVLASTAPKPSVSNDGEKSIVAQCLSKCVCGGAGLTAEKVLETYNYFLKNL